VHGRQVNCSTLARLALRLRTVGMVALLAQGCVTVTDPDPNDDDPGTSGAGGGVTLPSTNSSGGAAGGSSAQAGTSSSSGTASGGVPNQAGSGGQAGSGAVAGAPTTTGNCKRGIGAAGASLTNAQLLPGISWWYNWAVTRQALAPGLEFVPMIWGSGSLQGAAAALPAGATYLLGFNEPNFFEQANLSARAAAQLWPQLESIANAKGLDLVSPAVNFCGDDASKTGPCHDTNPVSYLEEFFAACTNCRVDYVAVHWYNCAAPELQFYLGQFRKFNRPIWLTEFACAYGGDTSVAGQEAYMRAAIPVLEADTRVHKYAWFSGDPLPTARLLEPSGELTPLGKVYASLPRGAGCKK
jgi:hypothetical protein